MALLFDPVGGDGSVTFDDATYGVLVDGTYTLTAQVSDVNGNVGSVVATDPATIVVDTAPPTVSITAPAGLVFRGRGRCGTRCGWLSGGFELRYHRRSELGCEPLQRVRG